MIIIYLGFLFNVNLCAGDISDYNDNFDFLFSYDWEMLGRNHDGRTVFIKFYFDEQSKTVKILEDWKTKQYEGQYQLDIGEKDIFIYYEDVNSPYFIVYFEEKWKIHPLSTIVAEDFYILKN